MTGEWGLPLLLAVTRAVRASNIEYGGSLVVWPIVGPAMNRLEPDGGWNQNTARKRHNGAKLSPEQAEEKAELIHPDTYTTAVAESVAEWAASKGVAHVVTNQPVPTPDTGTNTETTSFPDLKERAAPGWGFEFLRKVAGVQRDLRALDTTQNKARAVIETKLPTAVVFPGDFHLGGRGTDHERLLADFEMWKALYPAVRLAGMGDYSEQFSGKMARIGLHQHVMTNDMQLETVMDVFCHEEISPLWLTLLKGNHDGWAGAELSNYVMRMAQRCKVPFLGLGGELFLTVGEVEYKLALWHRYPGASALNKGNNQRRVRIDHNGSDVVALAHLHNAYVEFGQTGEQNHVGLRCGAYKTTDEHSRDAAGNVIADTRMPMVIFNPKERDMLYYEDYRKGIPELLRLRREWSQYPSFKVDQSRLQALVGA